MTAYDLALFEQLNEEYRAKPIVDRQSIAQRRLEMSPNDLNNSTMSISDLIRSAADRQLGPITRKIDIAGKHVLEIGCGRGMFSRAMIDHGNAARVTGVDITSHSTWTELTQKNLQFRKGDLSSGHLVPHESVDVIVSCVVFEHVTRPLRMLKAIWDTLRPNGSAWLRFNLYTARNASHRYSEVFFPWPHLLFDDEVFRAFYATQYNRTDRTAAWVNRMTIAHYLQACLNLGFEIESARRLAEPIDLPFYCRFEDRLGRYAALDLETNFLTLVLHKRPQTELTDIALASIDYIGRQELHDKRVWRFKRAQSTVAAD